MNFLGNGQNVLSGQSLIGCVAALVVVEGLRLATSIGSSAPLQALQRLQRTDLGGVCHRLLQRRPRRLALCRHRSEYRARETSIATRPCCQARRSHACCRMRIRTKICSPTTELAQLAESDWHCRLVPAARTIVCDGSNNRHRSLAPSRDKPKYPLCTHDLISWPRVQRGSRQC